MNMETETLGAHLRNLLTPYKNLLQLVKDGKADEETIRKYNLDNLDELIAFSNSEAMEQKNPEPASEDLEEAADCYKDMITPEEVDDTEHAYSYETYTEYQIADAFKAGAQMQKEKMMKDAIDGEVIDKGDFIKFADGKYIDLNPTMGAEPFVKLEDGDKVKVIIIKG